MSSEPFISNDLFVLYADVVLDKEYTLEEVKKKTQGLKERWIVLVKTEYLNWYLPWLLSLHHPYVLLTTCNDDMCMPYFHFPPKDKHIKNLHDRLLEHPYMLRWLTKHPSIRHPKLMALPLGPKWQYHSREFFGEDKQPILNVLHRHCRTPSEWFQSNKPNLLYINFDTFTTKEPFYQPHTNLRNLLLNWCGSQGFDVTITKLSFEDYLMKMKTYKFCMCPPGNGIDVHRAFESLMVGTIPIMVSTPLDSMYDDLPVWIIRNVSEITPENLKIQYERIRSRTYRFEQLYAPYWKEKIRLELEKS